MREASKAILSTRNIKINLLNPEKLLGDEIPVEDEVEGPPFGPYRRKVGKHPDPGPEGMLGVSSVRLTKQLEAAETHARALISQNQFRPSAMSQLFGLLDWNSGSDPPRGQAQGYELFGGFRHGGVQGISKAARRLPHVTSYLNAYLLAHGKRGVQDNTPSWTSVVVYTNPSIPPHVDSRNEPGTANFAYFCARTYVFMDRGAVGFSLFSGRTAQS